MKLYHGTGEGRLADVLARGIQPRGTGAHNWEHSDSASHPDCVYLTTAYAPYFAFAATKENKERIVLFEISSKLLTEARLAPDEDFLEQVTRKGDREERLKREADPHHNAIGHPEWGALSVGVRTKQYQGVMLTEYHDKWKLSLEHLGTCAYHGNVPTSAITRYSVYDALNPDNSVPYITSNIANPTISVENFRFCGGFYRKYTDWFFGGELPYEMFRGWCWNWPPSPEEEELIKTMTEADLALMPAGEAEKARAEVIEALQSHRGLEVYERHGRKFDLVYKDGRRLNGKQPEAQD